ncbi:hypothetical protein BGZ67_010588, partial [Mortierella alpina]
MTLYKLFSLPQRVYKYPAHCSSTLHQTNTTAIKPVTAATTKQLLVPTINHNIPKYSSNAINMSIFKRSNKNKTSSAASSVASTPAQTPRSSMQEQRLPLATTMTREQALEKIMKKTYG